MARADAEPVPASAILMQLANPVVPRAVTVAAVLGIADHLASGPRSAEELAEATQTHGPSLYRLLRALASLGVFVEGADGRFSLTPLAQPLRTDAPDSVRLFLMVTGQIALPAVVALEHSIRTGEPGFDHVQGMSWWEYFAAHPDAAQIHDAMFVQQSKAIAVELLDATDLSGIEVLVDLGGGYGGLSLPLLAAHPAMRGIIVDLPHLDAGARDQIRSAGLEDRCEFRAADFFESVPSGDAYLLKHVLRDWSDDDALRLLRTCRSVMPRHARLLIVDWVIPPGNEPGAAKFADLFVLAVLRGGRDRTEAQFRSILDDAGFRLDRVTPLHSGPSLLQATLRPPADR